ncbi:MAG: BrnT family toxin [bacterium]|nr:BrnT family toxin [bacterium]
MPLDFTWDRAKASANLKKHDVSLFEEASTAFGDPLSITVPDPGHSEDEARFVLVGQSFQGKLLVVVHSERERRDYEQV